MDKNLGAWAAVGITALLVYIGAKDEWALIKRLAKQLRNLGFG
jgi:hypothetical protein